MSDVCSTFKQVFPRDTKTRSFATKCLMLFEHLLPSVSPDNLEVFFKYFCHRVREQYGCLSTVQAIFGEMHKKAEKQRPNSIQACRAMISISDDEKLKLKRAGQKIVEKNNNHVHSFSQSQIEHVMRKLKQSTNPADKIVLLMLQSGMRLIEVLQVAHIAPSKTRPETYIVLSNLAKKNNNSNVEVEKPLLFTTYPEFKQQLQETRAYVQGKLSRSSTNKQITNLFNHAVNVRIRKVLGAHYSSHIARKIYGALSYKVFGDPNKQSFNAWLEKVLGHSSITTSLSYSNVHIR